MATPLCSKTNHTNSKMDKVRQERKKKFVPATKNGGVNPKTFSTKRPEKQTKC
jgi:hypothetical protein